MGGKSSNKSQQSDNTRTDNRAIQQEENSGIQVLGEGNKIYSTTTDHGAMNAAEEIAQIAGSLGKDAFDSAESLAHQSLEGMQNLSSNVIDKLAQSNFDNTQVIAGLSESQMSSNEEQLNAITELAKSAQTGGATEISKQQTKVITIVIGGSILLIGLFIWGMK